MSDNKLNYGEIKQTYDYRVALPLVFVIIFIFLIIALPVHKVSYLNDSSASKDKKLPTKQNAQVLGNNTSLKTISLKASLNPKVTTVNLAPNQSPFSIPTLSPQSDVSDSGSSQNSSMTLQNSNTKLTPKKII